MPVPTQHLLGLQDKEDFNFHGFIYIRYAAPQDCAVIIVSVYGGWIKAPALSFGIWHSFVMLKTFSN